MAFAIKNSTTIILPEWFSILERLAKETKEKNRVPLAIRMMPRDVSTHWNSTYNMLDFAYTYQKALKQITSNRNMKLRAYELSDDEWKIVKELGTVLKVCVLFLPPPSQFISFQ